MHRNQFAALIPGPPRASEMYNNFSAKNILNMHIERGKVIALRARTDDAHGGYMKYGKTILTIVFAMFLFAGALVSDASAQTGRVVVRGVVARPVVVRRYVRDP